MSIQALADSLGISISTVSRALNGYADVSEATRGRVFDAAKAMNYSPHPLAHRLATGNTGAVAILNPLRSGNAIDGSAALLHTGVVQVLGEQKYFVLSLTLPTDDNEMPELERLLAARLVDAVVLTRMRTDDSRVRLLQSRNMPFVTHGRALANAPHAWVDIDQVGSTAQATHALIALGHRRIAFLNGMPQMTFAHLREQGFRQALEEANIAPTECPLRNMDLTGAAGRQCAAQLLEQSAEQRPTAFVCASDALALGVIAAVREAGWQVGRDISVLGHGNTEAGQLSHPPLASVEHDLVQSGRHIAQHVLRLIAGEAAANLQHLEAPRLLLRATVAQATQPMQARR